MISQDTNFDTNLHIQICGFKNIRYCIIIMPLLYINWKHLQLINAKTSTHNTDNINTNHKIKYVFFSYFSYIHNLLIEYIH